MRAAYFVVKRAQAAEYQRNKLSGIRHFARSSAGRWRNWRSFLLSRRRRWWTLVTASFGGLRLGGEGLRKIICFYYVLRDKPCRLPDRPNGKRQRLLGR